MKQLASKLDQVQDVFDNVREKLNDYEFALGGGWEYDHGYFDKYLDEAHKVWLRIPFEVVAGRIEGETTSADALVKLGTPFVLKHVYNEGLDNEAEAETMGALFDQFQTPLDADAQIEDKWIKEAQGVLKQVETSWVH